MTSEQFVYWLQGFSELNTNPPTPEQWEIIQDHLGLVFKKVTPNYFKENPTFTIPPRPTFDPIFNPRSLEITC
jgi:hypothetical protein